VHANRVKLVAAEQKYGVALDALEEADVAFPTAWIFAPEYGNAPDDWLIQWYSPGQPRACQCG